MKIILLSDIHATLTNSIGRKDKVGATLFRKLAHVWGRARELGATIIQAGDFVDQPRDWGLLFLLGKFLKENPVPFYMVRGQHDMYMHAPDASATIPVLAEMGLVTLLDGELDIIRHRFPGACAGRILVTGVPFGKEPGANPAREKGVTRIMAIHAPIAEEALFAGHACNPAMAFAQKYSGFDIIICGDIHRAFEMEAGKTTLINTGPMLRLDAAQNSFTHVPAFYIYDTQTRELSYEEIPHQPAEEILTREHLEAVMQTTELMAEFVTAVRKTLGQETPGVDVHANLKRALKVVQMPETTRSLILEVVNATSN
jgi:predicted phosphodiesterase